MKRKLIRAAALAAILLLLASLCSGCGEKTEDTLFHSLEDLTGKKLGVLTGTVADRIAQEQIPGATVTFFDQMSDLSLALAAGKIDAYLADEPVAVRHCSAHPEQTVVMKVSEEDYGFVFPKTGAETVVNEMNEYLEKCRADGRMEAFREKWVVGEDEEPHVDHQGLTGEKGTLRFVTAVDGSEPFSYKIGETYEGYDVDMAVSFCREYGYAIEISDTNFVGLMAAMESGKADFAASCISITEERKQSLSFSSPNYHGGVVLVMLKKDVAGITRPEDLYGKAIAVNDGSVLDQYAQKHFPGCTVQYYKSTADLAVAVETGKADAYVTDEPLARVYLSAYPNQRILTMLEKESYAMIMPKDTEKTRLLSAQINEFLRSVREDGRLQEIDAIWFGTDEDAKTVDFSGLSGENGTLEFGISSEIGAPFTYIKENQFAGYEVDLAVRFCREYGYDLHITDYSLSGVMAAVTSGKCDLAGCCVTVTEERKQSVAFSDPDYEGGVVAVIRSAASIAKTEKGSVWASLKESLEKTFIREERWKLFTSGLGVTVLISVISAATGILLGFAAFLVYRKNHRPFNVCFDVLTDILQKTPVVVILMIGYYVIFGSSELEGIWVACICFSVMFATTVVGLLKMGVGAIDRGQNEAALALGYTDRQAFLRIILPQAARHFMPGLQSAAVALIKDTAIVGYIAVQDLTKVGDIVRSRTYEAFFPLIATAVIYFGIAWLITALLQRLIFRVDPSKRKKKNVLKGVKTK